MRLQKQLSRKASGRRYDKWIITVPPKSIKQLKWKAGTPLTSEIKENKLLISKAEDLSYNNFRDEVTDLLKKEQEGLSWEEIRTRIGLFQKVPNNVWVNKLIKDVGLYKEHKNKKVIWRLEK